MENIENKTEIEPTNPGVTVLQTNQAASGVPTWAKSLNTVTLTIVGVLLALGINFGSILSKWIDNRVETQTTELSQQGQLQADSLSALINMNQTMNNQIVQLLDSVDTLIEENKRLTQTNEEANKIIVDLQKQIKDIETLNIQYVTEIEDLKKQISALKQ